MIIFGVVLIKNKGICKQLNTGLNLSIRTTSLNITDMNTVLERFGIMNVNFQKFLEEHHHWYFCFKKEQAHRDGQITHNRVVQRSAS